MAPTATTMSKYKTRKTFNIYELVITRDVVLRKVLFTSIHASKVIINRPQHILKDVEVPLYILE